MRQFFSTKNRLSQCTYFENILKMPCVGIFVKHTLRSLYWNQTKICKPEQRDDNSYNLIIIRLLCRCAAVPAHEAYIAHTAHPVLRTHFGLKKEFGLYLALILRLSALSKGVGH